MVCLSPIFRGKVHKCITDILNAALSDCEGGAAGNAAVFPDGVLEIIAALPSAVHDACAEFKEKWNVLRPDPITTLPVELMVACFDRLGIDDRFAVSRVSRAWRRVALAAKGLWTEGYFRRGTLDNHAKLALLLSRSHPLPFRLTWHSGSLGSDGDDEDVLALVIKNMGRLQSFTANVDSFILVAQIFDHPAPQLRSLSLGWNHDRLATCPLPGSWGDCRSPLLEDISISGFYIPEAFEALPTVRTFRGSLADPSSSDVLSPDSRFHRFFDMLPHLVSLDLRNLTQKAVNRLCDVPRSLREIQLSCEEDPIDYSRFIAGCRPSGALALCLDTADAIAESIDAFAAKICGTWSMTVLDSDYPNVRVMSEAGALKIQFSDMKIARGLVLYLHALEDKWWAEPGAAVPAFDRLGALTLPLDLLFHLYDLQDWHRAFPHLQALAITEADGLAVYEPRTASSPIRTPPLERVSVDWALFPAADGLVAWLLALPRLVRYDRARLEVVTIETDEPDDLREEDLGALAPLAGLSHHVRVKDSVTDEVVFDIFPGPGSPSQRV